MSDEKFKIPQNGQLVAIDVRCKDCFHFRKERASIYADVCEKLGVLKEARPCRKYLPNADGLSFNNQEMQDLAEILRKIPTNKLPLIAGLINHERKTRKGGFYSGQIVYIKIYGDDYLSNYAKAWVMLTEANRVIVQGCNGFRGSFLKESVLTEEKFAVKAKVLKMRKRINDPRKKTYNIPKIKIEPAALKEYEPPTIDGLIVKPVVKKNTSNDIFIRGDNVKA